MEKFTLIFFINYVNSVSFVKLKQKKNIWNEVTKKMLRMKLKFDIKINDKKYTFTYLIR